MNRRRSLAAGGATIGALLLVAVAVLAFDVGTSRSHYPSAPDPCRLLSDETVRELVTDPVTTSRSDRAGRPRWFEPHHETEHRVCSLNGPGFDLDRDGRMEASIRVSVNRYTDTQLDLGPTGVERAQERYDRTRDGLRAHEQAECLASVKDSRADVCGVPSHLRDGFTLLIRRENVYVSVSFDGGLVRASGPVAAAEYPDPWLEQRMTEATSRILSQLDEAR